MMLQRDVHALIADTRREVAAAAECVCPTPPQRAQLKMQEECACKCPPHHLGVCVGSSTQILHQDVTAATGKLGARLSRQLEGLAGEVGRLRGAGSSAAAEDVAGLQSALRSLEARLQETQSSGQEQLSSEIAGLLAAKQQEMQVSGRCSVCDPGGGMGWSMARVTECPTRYVARIHEPVHP